MPYEGLAPVADRSQQPARASFSALGASLAVLSQAAKPDNNVRPYPASRLQSGQEPLYGRVADSGRSTALSTQTGPSVFSKPAVQRIRLTAAVAGTETAKVDARARRRWRG